MTLFTLASFACLVAGDIAIPKCNDDRLVLELFAADPDIVTPVGISVDDRGNLLVIECHTHFPPSEYDGPKHDRIRRFEDTDGNGKADRVATFWEGSSSTMGIGRHPTNGWTYVATRDTVFRLKDADSDGKAELNEPLISLESNDNYPHNGLSGFAFDREGNVYFGFGENHAEPFEMTATDGTRLTGIEGGHVYRMRADGSRLERVSIGCWNPFHMTFDEAGRLFVVDNDPDSMPPCRLLHIVPGGDYGYKYRNGRKGTHPYTAWNGELPGTLPMVAGTGEAPSGIWGCGTGDKLPSDYRGDLLVTSWGDHRIERYRLSPRGASVVAERTDVVRGDENFRPVGIVAGADGILYFTDWVDKSYELHRKGRIWRLRTKKAEELPSASRPKVPKTSEELLAEKYRTTHDSALVNELWQACESTDPFMKQAAREGLKRNEVVASNVDSTNLSAGTRLAVLLILRERNDEAARARLPEFLQTSDPAIRLEALRWIGEERVVALRDQLPKVLTAGPITARLFATYLATIEKLDQPPRPDVQEITNDQYVADALLTADLPDVARRWGLRTLDPQHEVVTAARMKQWLQSADAGLRIEAVRTLRESAIPERDALLERIATNEALDEVLRAEAIVGLVSGSDSSTALLLDLACNENANLAKEALRSLRGGSLDEPQRERVRQLAHATPGLAELCRRVLAPAIATTAVEGEDKSVDDWLKVLEESGDARAGERIFFHSKAAGCYRCHQMDGRGGRLGPDLSTMARSSERRRLVESIVQPSREIAPQFVPWALQTVDGKSYVGLFLGETLQGEQRYADSAGKVFVLARDEIDTRQPLPTSIMPSGLAQQLTSQEFRDLLAYLQQRP